MIAPRRRLLAALAAFVASPAAAAEARRDPDTVYHLADIEKANFVLGNLRNHLAGAEGKPKLAVVIHGAALQLFHRGSAPHGLEGEYQELVRAGVVFYACANTLAAHGWKLGDMLDGFALAERGGVVELAELQGRGYAYLRP